MRAARPVRRAAWGNGSGAIPAPRPRPTQLVAVGSEQFLLLTGIAGAGGCLGVGVEAFDAAHDQAALDVVGFASAGERGVVDLGDLRVADQALLVVVPDRIRIRDGRPIVLADAGDRRSDSRICPGRDGEPHHRPAGRGDHVVAVEGTISAQDDQPRAVRATGASSLRGLQRITNEPGGAAGGVGAALAEPGRADHRCRQRRAHGRDQRVQALHAAVAEAGALLGVAVGRLHGVIDVDVGDLIGTSQQRCPAGELAEQRGRDTVELPDVPEGERPQERPQRRGGPDPTEQPVHPAVPQQIHVIDAVRTGDHPGDQGGDLQVRVHPTQHGQCELAGDQVGQATPLGQGDHWRQARAGHQIRIVERRGDQSWAVRNLHPADAPSESVERVLRKPHSPYTAGHPRSTTGQTALSQRWIQADRTLVQKPESAMARGQPPADRRCDVHQRLLLRERVPAPRPSQSPHYVDRHARDAAATQRQPRCDSVQLFQPEQLRDQGHPPLPVAQ